LQLLHVASLCQCILQVTLSGRNYLLVDLRSLRRNSATAPVRHTLLCPN